MRNRFLACAFGVALASSALADANLREQISKARDKVYPALVNVQMAIRGYQGGRAIRVRAAGSGVVVSPDGLVLTNHHVAGNAKKLVCTLASGEEIEADLVGTDPATDIALMRLRLSERKPGAPPLHYANLGDSDSVQVGDYVLAMGNPMFRSNSVSLGIVANCRRVNLMGMMEGEMVGAALLWIQHDALIMGGNSGGPLVSLSGEVVGINESSFGDPRGGGMFGMAIPANAAREVMREILKTARDGQGGRVVRSWLGVSVQPLLEEMRSRGIDKGILVSSVVAGSPAAKAGIEPGDRILRVGGEPTNALGPEDVTLFTQRVSRLPVGQEVEIQLARGEALRTARLATVEWEKPLRPEREFKAWGFTARDITKPLARDLKLEDASGVLVTGVRPGGPFGRAKPPIQGGIVRAVAGGSVSDCEALEKALERVLAEKREKFLVEVEVGAERILSVVEAQEKEEMRRGREIPKAWLGCTVQVVTQELAGALELARAGGVRVTQVLSDSPAAKAGLAAGDIVTSLDGQRVPAEREGDREVFQQMIRQRKVGDEITLAGLRAGRELSLTAKLAPTPLAASDALDYKDKEFEFTARDIVFLDRVANKWDKNVQGCLVSETEPSGWAGWSGLLPGDLIQAVNDRTVADVTALKHVMSEVKRSRPPHVIFRVLRGVSSQFVDAEPEWEE